MERLPFPRVDRGLLWRRVIPAEGRVVTFLGVVVGIWGFGAGVEAFEEGVEVVDGDIACGITNSGISLLI